MTEAALFVSCRLATRRRPCECTGTPSTAVRAALRAWDTSAEAAAAPDLTHLWSLALTVPDLTHVPGWSTELAVLSLLKHQEFNDVSGCSAVHVLAQRLWELEGSYTHIPSALEPL